MKTFSLGVQDLEWSGKGTIRFKPNALIVAIATAAARAGVSLSMLRNGANVWDWLEFEVAIGADVSTFIADQRVPDRVVMLVQDVRAKFLNKHPTDPALSPKVQTFSTPAGVTLTLITNPHARKL